MGIWEQRCGRQSSATQRFKGIPGFASISSKESNYEVAYNHVLYSGSFGKNIQEDFAKAVEQSYQQMHEAIWGRTVRIKAMAACRAIVRPFAGTGSDERGFVFTLNQDLLLERFFSNSDVLANLRIPGISNFPPSNSTLPTKHTDEYKKVDVPDNEKVQKLEADFWNDKAYGRFVYLKLHGSYWWKSADGSNAMVIGNEKTSLIKGEPYLSWSRRVFQNVLRGPGCNLFVIGYGFGDHHINTVIAESIDKHQLRLYVVSPEPPEDFRNKLTRRTMEEAPAAAKIWPALHGYYYCRVTDLYSGANGDLTPRGKSFCANLVQ